jgi:hypothetical protein
MSLITFETNSENGYPSRTIENASADVTIAFAVDFNSAGEKLTKKAVLQQGKLYIPFPIEEYTPNLITDVANKIIALNKPEITLNIAGNGMYTLRNSGFKEQEIITYLTWRALDSIIKKIKDKVKVTLIRSGGQTGFDEAGIKAAVKLGIPALVHAPKNWLFRDIEGNDYTNEEVFKNRFA